MRNRRRDIGDGCRALTPDAFVWRAVHVHRVMCSYAVTITALSHSFVWCVRYLLEAREFSHRTQAEEDQTSFDGAVGELFTCVVSSSFSIWV